MKDTDNERAREFLTEVERAATAARLNAIQMSFGGRIPPIEYMREFHPDLVMYHPESEDEFPERPDDAGEYDDETEFEK